MIKEMKGWKVIRAKDRTSTSSSCYSIQYPANIEVFPTVKGSKLFFFKSYHDAIDFSKSFPSLKHIIVPCIARNVTQPKWMCFFTTDIPRFWNSKNRSKDYGRFPVVKGTMFAESIKCLE